MKHTFPTVDSSARYGIGMSYFTKYIYIYIYMQSFLTNIISGYYYFPIKDRTWLLNAFAFRRTQRYTHTHTQMHTYLHTYTQSGEIYDNCFYNLG